MNCIDNISKSLMLCLCFLFAVSGLCQSNQSQETSTTESTSEQVIRVPAGDTLILANNQIVRLAGIDTYEPFSFGWIDSINPNRLKLAYQALDMVRQHVLNQTVSLKYVPELSDIPERKWAYVYLSDNRCLNELLLKEGLAQILPGTPKHPKKNTFEQILSDAKSAGVGIWAVDYSSISVTTGVEEYTDTTKKRFEEPEKYYPPGYTKDTESHSSSSTVGGIILLIVILGAITGVLYAVLAFKAKKSCPMCHANIPRSAKSCSSCGYNYSTGYVGDAELQTWMTQNLRVRKTPGKKKKKLR